MKTRKMYNQHEYIVIFKIPQVHREWEKKTHDFIKKQVGLKLKFKNSKYKTCVVCYWAYQV